MQNNAYGHYCVIQGSRRDFQEVKILSENKLAVAFIRDFGEKIEGSGGESNPDVLMPPLGHGFKITRRNHD
jgi:hypothetical protein